MSAAIWLRAAGFSMVAGIRLTYSASSYANVRYFS